MPLPNSLNPVSSFTLSENLMLRNKNSILVESLENYKQLYAAARNEIICLQKELYEEKKAGVHYKELCKVYNSHVEQLLKGFTQFSQTSLMPFIEFGNKASLNFKGNETSAEYKRPMICGNVIRKPVVHIERISSQVLQNNLAHENDSDESNRLSTVIEEEENQNNFTLTQTMENVNVTKLNQEARVYLQRMDNISCYLEEANNSNLEGKTMSRKSKKTEGKNLLDNFHPSQVKKNKKIKHKGNIKDSDATFQNSSSLVDVDENNVLIPCDGENQDSILKNHNNRGTIYEINLTTSEQQEEILLDGTNNLSVLEPIDFNTISTSTPYSPRVILIRTELSENKVENTPTGFITQRRRFPQDGLVKKKNKFYKTQTSEWNYNEPNTSKSLTNPADDCPTQSTFIENKITNENVPVSNLESDAELVRPSRRARPTCLSEPSLRKKMRR